MTQTVGVMRVQTGGTIISVAYCEPSSQLAQLESPRSVLRSGAFPIQRRYYTFAERLTGSCAACLHPQRLHGKRWDGRYWFHSCAVRRGFLEECPCELFQDSELQPLWSDNLSVVKVTRARPAGAIQVVREAAMASQDGRTFHVGAVSLALTGNTMSYKEGRASLGTVAAALLPCSSSR